ncbi:hypothetical protein VB715_11330 [Crocosphaera sp. UHCC 0190]|uniref:hypothetical protein n=1 Tax=Crocosphaera sp. UHCC 0190 TaxID=3110246 RepID=UPI002B2178D3|nr:hypothetical protein [Crocosphaera sp. UHCC 0190]MEA5510356.1 hypothetical protein [Crocosphaera sp. UHCC 0190]
MVNKISPFCLVILTYFGLTNMPIFAQNTTSQTGNLEATVSGENNQVYQTINQTIITHPGMGSIRRNSSQDKNHKRDIRSSSHQHSEDREHPRKNHR